MREDIKSFITSVQKPGRYTGSEQNDVFKNLDEVDLRVAFCFPDTYEIGMSNLGMRILCGCLNGMDRVWCERVYAPWTDMEEEMLKRDIPLFTHESGDAICDFNMVAFTLQYELCYTTMLNMLKLGRVPVLASERGEDDPLVVVGGPCSYNPEPVADFVDMVLIGEGEELIKEIAQLWLDMKKDGTYSRKNYLYRAATELKGVYVPSLYDISYNDDGTIRAITTRDEKVPEKVVKRIVENMDECYVPKDPVMPFIETVQDRVSLEVGRGCIRGCRFCQAGMTWRPVREKSPDVINGIAHEMWCNSGYSEVSLSSLSISDYTKIQTLTTELLEWTNEKKVNLALPSMRADSFTKELMDKISSVRSSTITFAPEAGSQRLRDVINKNITEEEILRAVRIAYAAGKNAVKLYFMDGLPYESYEDIAGIAALAKDVADEYYKVPESNKKRSPQITLSVACFIPKPFTPFQWEGQDTPEELEQKQKYLLSQLNDRRIKYNYHDATTSRLEAVFARGDRRLSKALLEALNRHVRLDSWTEMFSYDSWMDIFSKTGIDPAFYANRDIADDEILPWDMLDCGVTKKFMINERHRAQEAATTPSCKEKCSGCGANRLADKKYCRWCPGHPESEDDNGMFVGENTPDAPKINPNAGNVKIVRDIRIRYRKYGPMLYISHLDLARVMTKSVIRAEIPLYYTEGFNPIPKLVFATPLSVGCGGKREIMDFRLVEQKSNVSILEALRKVVPDGIEILECYTPKDKLKDIVWAENEIIYSGAKCDDETLAQINEMFLHPVVIMKKSKSGEKETDITTLMKSVRAEKIDDELHIFAVTSANSENYLNPEYIAGVVEDRLHVTAGNDKAYHYIMRNRLLLADGETDAT